ncbi:MAG TPA: neutral zinc metallopeptidase [Longimicrobiales bacterium]|nr:neutral zinc metallopeptidase [Longimicrobiales bacterium]
MRWQGRRGSSNVEDRRGIPVRGAVGGGIGLVAVVVIAMLFGVDPSAILGGADPSGGYGGAPAGEQGVPEDEGGRFAAVVLADTEDTWNRIFAERGAEYPEPTLVLFSGAVASACGTASSAVGPFYCPQDARVYVDLDFFRELRQRFGAPGDFAQAYVIAHEVGHHVQNVTGAMHGFTGYAETGPGSSAVRMELQADCYAGVWAHDQGGRDLLEPGDIEEALDAAAAIGDDAIQRRTQGTIVPESFTHGTSEQRARWFRIGYESGDPEACDT